MIGAPPLVKGPTTVKKLLVSLGAALMLAITVTPSAHAANVPAPDKIKIGWPDGGSAPARP